jgi:hypothetical protein
VWKRQIDGRVLTFRLAGINNQNFLMRDEETGSYWQQISGQAIAGPLKGKQLELVPCDELSFAQWKAEHPKGTVLRPAAEFAGKYAPKNWETRMLKQKTVVDTAKTGIGPRELMVGIVVEGKARAYPMARIEEAKLIQDRVGATPLIVVLGADGKSVRVFEARLPESPDTPEFYRDPQAKPGEALLTDSASASRWTFDGCAVTLPAKGYCLKQVNAIKDYWFDWKAYHPETTVFGR